VDAIVTITGFTAAMVDSTSAISREMDRLTSVSHIATRRCLMRSMPDSTNDQPVSDASVSLSVTAPTLTLKEPVPAEMAALGQEVLELVHRKQRGSLDASPPAAHDLSAILHVTGVRVTPKKLYYVALRVKWMQDTTTMIPVPWWGR